MLSTSNLGIEREIIKVFGLFLPFHDQIKIKYQMPNKDQIKIAEVSAISYRDTQHAQCMRFYFLLKHKLMYTLEFSNAGF